MKGSEADSRITAAQRAINTLITLSLNRQPTKDADKKIQVIRAAVREAFPAAGINAMLAEIEAGYLPGREP